MIGAHVRLLVVIPLFFLCESWVDPRMTVFIRTIVRSGVVSPHAIPALEYEVARICRWKESWLAEAMCLLAAVLLPLIGPQLFSAGVTATYDPSAVAGGGLAGQWYWIVCLTLFRFLMFRWLWRLGLWCYFLWRVARLELHLVPTHPDGAAGLGYLEVVHIYFTPLVLAISAVRSASFAEEISTGRTTFEAIYPTLALILVVGATLFIDPLFIFTPQALGLPGEGLERLYGIRVALRKRLQPEMAGRGRCTWRTPVGHTGHTVPGRLGQQHRYRAQYALGSGESALLAGYRASHAAADIAAASIEVSDCRIGPEILHEAIRPVTAVTDSNR